MRSEDELRDLLDKTAEAIADFSGNPRSWLTWISYLMEQLEKRAVSVDPLYQELYRDLLRATQDALRNRLSTGSW